MRYAWPLLQYICYFSISYAQNEEVKYSYNMCSNSMFIIENAHGKLGRLPDLDELIIYLKKIIPDGWGKSWQKLDCHLDPQD